MAFVDYENIWTGLVERGFTLSPEELVKCIQRYADKLAVDLRAVYLYANFDREEFWRTQTAFEKTTVFTRHVYGKNNYSQTDLRPNAADLELMLEALEILLTRPSTIDIFLLFTGDGDFFSLVRKIRAWGKEVKIIGVDGSVHHALKPHCESFDVFCDLLNAGTTPDYDPEDDVPVGIETIAELQKRLLYVGSTKARAALSEKLGYSMPKVKALVRYLIRQGIITEQEYPDPNLKIGKTKIYLLNLEHDAVKKALGTQVNELADRYHNLRTPNRWLQAD